MVLSFLWIGLFFVTVIAFFAIVFIERYPKGLFNFSVGVLRWTWRVEFYAFGVLGTDRYPPFSLQPSANYPARLEISYPDKLSRGLVLVKWWLLALPHLAIVAAIYDGLIFVLLLIAAVALLFTGKYPVDVFKLIMGLNRWAYRVWAYVSLLTDEYPPFRLEE